ncbi:AAA-like domain-containing protein, partial [Candidatus Poribacteria bacterium]|nr:AAA-like domain-containing protein [Candidatus Poribacteria bacterium]
MTPFKAGGALNPEEYSHIIVHRPELDRILDHIDKEDLYIALRSPRQTGKTTLLYQIMAHLHGHGWGVVHLDLSGLSNLDGPAFYQTICADIHDQLGELIDAADAMVDYQQVANQIDFSNYLTRLSTHTPRAHKLIIMLDEIEGVPEEVASPFFSSLRRFFHRGQRPSRQRSAYRKVVFIFAGALGLQRLSQGENSPLRNVCKSFSLDDFSREQVRELANNLQGYPPECAAAIVDVVHGWCDGHPYLTQCLYALIYNSQVCRAASVDQLPEVVGALVETAFVYGDDANLVHIFNNHLRPNEAYHEPVFAIFEGRRKSTML